MNSHRITTIAITILSLAVSGGVATALTASSSTSSAITITQALAGQGSIVGGALLGSSTPSVLPSFATTTAAASTTPGLGILSEHNKLSITGSCVVKTSGNAKQCVMYVSYTTATGSPVIGIPVRIATMNGEGSFTDANGPLLIKESPGNVLQYSGILPGVTAQDVATYVGPATATSTLFVALTPDGLRAQDTFASSTAVQ